MNNFRRIAVVWDKQSSMCSHRAKVKVRVNGNRIYRICRSCADIAKSKAMFS